MSELATDLLNRIGNIIPILPVALVATVVLRKRSNLNELELKSSIYELFEQLEKQGYRAYIPRGNREYAVTVGIRMLTLRHLILDQDGIYSVNPKEVELLNYYANSIAHLVETLPEPHFPTHVS